MVPASSTPTNRLTSPQARLAREGQGKAVKLRYTGRALMENRNALAVNDVARVTDGTVIDNLICLRAVCGIPVVAQRLNELFAFIALSAPKMTTLWSSIFHHRHRGSRFGVPFSLSHPAVETTV